MASRQTEHFGLHLWEAEDDFLRTEFNEDNRKVDAALCGKCEVVIGSYVGASDMTTQNPAREFTLGFEPKAVHVEKANGERNQFNAYGGLALPGQPLRSGDLSITPTGFCLSGGPNNYLNQANVTYYYIAYH